MVDHQIIICNIPFIYPGEIKDSAKRHVWVKSALMFIQIHGSANQKGYIILHNRSLYCRLWVCLLWRDFFFCFLIAYLHYNRKQFISKFAISHVSCRYNIFLQSKNSYMIYDSIFYIRLFRWYWSFL